MMKKILLSITLLGLLVLTGIIFLVTFRVKEVEKPQEIRTKAAPATVLSLQPATKTVGLNESFNLEVRINTGTNIISAVQLDIMYNQSKLEVLSIQNGTFLPNVLIPANINQANGRASITLGCSPTEPKQGTGTLAVLSFKTLPITDTNPTQILFTPETKVAAIGEGGNVTVGLNPATITIQNATLNVNLKFQGVNTSRPDKIISVALKQENTIINSLNLTLTANASGVYSGQASNITPGTYDIFVKGPVHLQKGFSGITLAVGETTKDWTATPLRTGDAVALPSSSFNKVDIYDYNKIVEHFGPRIPAGGSPADFDLDGDVDIFDYNFLVGNFNQVGD